MREWIVARLTALVGQYYASQWGGKWDVQGDPTKPHFLEIVVDGFVAPRHADLIIDPFYDAVFFIDSEPGRSLSRMVSDRSVIKD